MTRYYFILASQDFLFYQEPVEEIIRERMSHYNSLKKDIDFWVTTDLGFLVNEELLQKITKPAAAVISLNPRFINWLKLRVQYGIKGSFVSSDAQQYNTLFQLEESVST